MKWNELTITTTEEAQEMISNFLHELGAGGVSIEESGTTNRKRDNPYGEWYEIAFNDIPEGIAVIKGYFSDDMNADEMIAALKPRIEQLREFDIDPGQVEYSAALVDDDDWATAWKQYFKPIRVSDTLTIKPTWEEYEASPEEKIIELDPGMAFGTGTHPTTSLCLQTLESVVTGGEEMIDVGTGSGILAIGACLLGVKSVLALDLDPVAVSSAIENVALNGLSEQVEVRLSDLLGVINEETSANDEGAGTSALKVTVPVDLVVANILAEVILMFVDDVYAALKPNGIYIASGVYKNKETHVEEGLIQSGFEIIEKLRDEEWIAFVARKPKVG